MKTGGKRDLTGLDVSVVIRYNGLGGLDFHPELNRFLGAKYTQDPWTFSDGHWEKPPKDNGEHYLKQLLPEFE